MTIKPISTNYGRDDNIMICDGSHAISLKISITFDTNRYIMLLYFYKSFRGISVFYYENFQFRGNPTNRFQGRTNNIMV